MCKERAARGLFEKCGFALRIFFNSPLTALFLHSSLTAARPLRRGLTVLFLHHRFCKFKGSSELQNYVFEGSFCSTDFFFRNSRTAANYKITFLRVRSAERNLFSNFQGQQRITKFCFWGFVLPNRFIFQASYKALFSSCLCLRGLLWIIGLNFLHEFFEIFKNVQTSNCRILNDDQSNGESQKYRRRKKIEWRRHFLHFQR